MKARKYIGCHRLYTSYLMYFTGMVLAKSPKINLFALTASVVVKKWSQFKSTII